MLLQYLTTVIVSNNRFLGEDILLLCDKLSSHFYYTIKCLTKQLLGGFVFALYLRLSPLFIFLTKRKIVCYWG